MPNKICVIGAGVIGLSTAHNILENIPDVEVTVVSESFSPQTTSNIAAGFWRPYRVSDTPQYKVDKWSTHTWDYLLKLCYSAEADDAGTFLTSGRELYRGEVNEPVWKDKVLGYRLLTKQELNLYPSRYTWGFFYTTVIADQKKYLPYLQKKIQAKGVQLIQKKLVSFDELGPQFDLIVNCTGLGSKLLCNDNKMIPSRGHVIRVHAPWIKHFTVAPDDFLHILSTYDNVSLGMTDREDSDPGLKLEDRNRIIQGCLEIEPSLARATNMVDHLGFRPVRSEVRLEVELKTIKGRMVPVVHNYGHGGCGITLHWGCANEATELVQKLITKPKL